MQHLHIVDNIAERSIKLGLRWHLLGEADFANSKNLIEKFAQNPTPLGSPILRHIIHIYSFKGIGTRFKWNHMLTYT